MEAWGRRGMGVQGTACPSSLLCLSCLTEHPGGFWQAGQWARG